VTYFTELPEGARPDIVGRIGDLLESCAPEAVEPSDVSSHTDGEWITITIPTSTEPRWVISTRCDLDGYWVELFLSGDSLPGGPIHFVNGSEFGDDALDQALLRHRCNLEVIEGDEPRWRDATLRVAAEPDERKLLARAREVEDPRSPLRRLTSRPLRLQADRTCVYTVSFVDPLDPSSR
jgi:hypothetical protein